MMLDDYGLTEVSLTYCTNRNVCVTKSHPKSRTAELLESALMMVFRGDSESVIRLLLETAATVSKNVYMNTGEEIRKVKDTGGLPKHVLYNEMVDLAERYAASE